MIVATVAGLVTGSAVNQYKCAGRRQHRSRLTGEWDSDLQVARTRYYAAWNKQKETELETLIKSVQITVARTVM